VSTLVRGTKYDPPRGQVAFEKAVIEAVDFRGTSWDDFSATNSLFVECDFREARFAHAVLGSRQGQTRYVRCVFDQSDLRVADPGTARFEACQFEEAKIEGWLGFLSEFVDCRFAGRMVGVTFSGRPWGPGAERVTQKRSINEFRGNDFRRVDLIDCSFVRGIDLRVQSLPGGSDYIFFDRATRRIANAKQAVSAWPDQARTAALILLDVYSTAGYEEQNEIFTHRWDLVPTVSREVTDRVWRLIEDQ
jgi:hypothetical protein